MDAAEIEQTNKLRKSLGLAPLPVPGAPTAVTFKEHSSSPENSDTEGDEPASTLETREAAGYGNWQQLQEDAIAKKRREAKALAIKKARDAAQRFARLEGKGLGDVDDDGDVDTKAWLKGSSKRAKNIAAARARMLEEEMAERDRLAAVEYAAKDLAGVRVAHELGEFTEADGEQILTLVDKAIGDGDDDEEEGDELEVTGLREKEKLQEKLELKKRRPVYDPNAINETGERQILQQYDEEIEGKKRKAFHLDAQGRSVEERDAKRAQVGEALRAQPITLDILGTVAESDYMPLDQVKIKKPKKSKKKSTRQRPVDDDDIFPTNRETNGVGDEGTSMEVDAGPITSKANDTSMNGSLIDDDDLSAALAMQRKAAFKKKRLKPEDIVRQIQEEESTAAQGSESGDADGQDGGLVIDETSEFVANLEIPVQQSAKPTIHPSIESTVRASASDDEDDDVKMGEFYNDIEDEDELIARLKREKSTNTPDRTTTGLEAEAEIDQGLGATVNMLKQRGLLKTAAEEDANKLLRDRQRFLAEKIRREAEAEQRARIQREKDRASGKFERMSGKEREEYARWQNKQHDQMESLRAAEIFNREYKPGFQIRYTDEAGRTLSQKEAFKQMSHQFHGKGSGKQKTEKHMKKVEDEKKREAVSILDASEAVGMNNAMGTTAKKNKQAGVRLA